jgi:hypothetical protein
LTRYGGSFFACVLILRRPRFSLNVALTVDNGLVLVQVRPRAGFTGKSGCAMQLAATATD